MFFFCLFFFLCHKMEKLHNSTQWSLGNLLWSNEGEGVHMLIMCVILMMTDIVMHRQGWVTWWTTRFLLIKLLCQPFCICFGIVVLAICSTFFSYDYLELYGANVTYLRKLLSYLLLYMIISLMIAMMRNLFILIALICMVFVFVIVSPAEYQRNELHIFWRNSGK